MGFESFRVQLEGGTATEREVNEVIQRLPHIEPDSGFINTATYYLMNDGRHKIEMEVWDHPVSISCRFTLCHPPSVDLAFLNLIRELMERLGMDVTIYDDVEPEHEHPFSLGEFAEFSTVSLRSIAARRDEWIRFLGNETFGATTDEACERIILQYGQSPAGWHPVETLESAKPVPTQLT